MNNKVKILLPKERSVTSEDVDMFLTVDLNQEFMEFKKERFDNDFDLAAQFVKERNASQNFIIYGVVTSTAVDCVGLSIKVYSDSERTQQIATITPTSISYDQNNPFGKKNGKYFIKLENYQYEYVYFKIETNNFSYRDQEWEQQLVFLDADGNYVPYGTETIDINSDGDSIAIENDFPFFFNKHWIRQDYDMTEEKVAKVSFDIGIQTLAEGQSGQLIISLDKPSPFGLEMLRLNLIENSAFSNSYVGSMFVLPNVPIIAMIGSQSQYEGKISITLQVPSDKVRLLWAGAEMAILDGSYSGIHTILHTRFSIVEPYTNLYQVILDADYDQAGTNSTASSFRIGTQPDISFTMNGQSVTFPMELFWQVNEVEKVLQFNVNNDFEAEFTEFVDLKLTDLLRCEEGSIMQSKIIFEDATPRNYVSLFLGPTYENGVSFTGRTYIGQFDPSNLGTTASHSILRNGYRFEGRSEEFYPTIGYTLKITNSGNRTIMPVNPDLGITTETIFEVGETKQFYLTTRYTADQRHSIRLQFSTAEGQPGSLNGSWAIAHEGRPYTIRVNGIDTTRMVSRTGYNAFRQAMTVDSWSFYSTFQVVQPFDVQLDNVLLTATITSKSPGVKLDVYTNDETITATTITPFFEKRQEEYNIILLANSNENTTASYTFSFESQGFRPLMLPKTELEGSSIPIPYYMVTSYSPIMRPYHDELAQPYYGSGSTTDGLYFYQVDGAYPTRMMVGSAFVNGIAFLSDNNTPGSRENLTRYGLGEGQFVAGFLPERVTPIQGTFEPIVVQPSAKVISLKIPYTNYSEPFIRSFDFRFGNAGNETIYTLGGLGQLFRNNAQWWWSNNIAAVNEGVVLPMATLQQRLDIGVDTNAEGPVFGQLLDPSTLRLISKTSGADFSIDNIANYENVNESALITQEVIIPNVLEGDVNPANNGLGGFSI